MVKWLSVIGGQLSVFGNLNPINRNFLWLSLAGRHWSSFFRIKTD